MKEGRSHLVLYPVLGRPVIRSALTVKFVVDYDIQVSVVACVGCTGQCPGHVVAFKDRNRVDGIKDRLSKNIRNVDNTRERWTYFQWVY
jgi:hypothetical protein